MNTTLEQHYRGWDITILTTLSRYAIDEVRRAPHYFASAVAALQSTERPSEWIDPRMQMVTLGNRSFADGPLCTQTLLSDVKEIIDALKK